MSVARHQSGYIMLPVMLTVVMVATIAFMMNHEGSMGGRRVSSELEAAQARYVAEAGLQHALWQTEQQGCGPYTDFTNQPMGSHSYTTSLTSGLGSTTGYSIAVDQDTWIRSDIPTSNSSGDSNLHIRFGGGVIERPMYRYDLSSLPANASILSATAWFYVSKEHPEGPVDVHLLTEDWVDTTATWDSMGANMDSTVLATIPTQPTAGVWVSVNLTAQVQAWVNGQSNYGITLNSTSEGTHGDYASIEAAQQPYLQVVTGSASVTPASLKSIGTLASGTHRTIQRQAVALYQTPPSYRQLRLVDKDAMLDSFYNSRDYGVHELEVSLGSGSALEHSLLQFELPSIPPGSRMISAQLELYHDTTSRSAGTPVVEVYRVTRGWVEGTHDGTGTADGATWDTWDGSNSWTSAGGDYATASVASSEISPATGDWESWEIGALVQGWIDGRYPNHGLLLKGTGDFDISFASKEDADAALHPKLSITYACECGQACMTPQGSGNILFVVSNAWDMTAGELAKKSLFESWGYAVVPLSQWDVSWAFDTAVAVSDVVYVSEAVDSNTSGMAPKLATTTLGVINEEGALNDELGLASGLANPVGNSIAVTDSSHYITQPFAAGDLQIYTAKMEVLIVSGTQAAGLQTLAEWGGAGTLAVLENDDDLYGGGSAPARRVMLPIGRDAEFNWDYLNNNGRLIVQRAIEWGIEQAPFVMRDGLLLSTLDDVTGSDASGLAAWSDGTVLSFADPNMSFEPGTSDGTFRAVVNLDDFGNGADIDALHYVSSHITVGSANSVDLQPGDLLISTADNETLTSLNSLSVNDEDVFVFRPASEGDYSAGSFIFLIDGSQIHAQADTVGISLVEKDTLVGDRTPRKGKFLIAISGRQDVLYFAADDVGLGTTAGNKEEMIDGPTLHFASEIGGLDLAEDEVTLGGHTIPAGSILLTLQNDGSSAGDNYLWVDSEDIFYLSVTQTGSSPVADAILLLDGSDVKLDSDQEHLQALTLTTTVSAEAAKSPIAHWKLDETSGNTAVDSEGGHDGTLTNYPAWVTGQVDGALSFDGASDFVEVPHDTALTFTQEMTFSAWINATSFGSGYQAIIAKDVPGNGKSNYWFGNWQSEIAFGFFADSAFRTVQSAGLNLQPGTWYHLAASFDNTTDQVVLYFDGSPVQTGSITFEPTTETANLWIGHSVDGEYWPGMLDDVRIYDSVLSGSEIADLYTEGSSGGGTIDPPAPSGVVFQEFTEASLDSNGTTLNIAKPAGTAAGNLLIAAVATDGNSASSLAAPAGWNSISVGANASNSVTFGVWWKIAGSGEPSQYPFTWSGKQEAYGWIMRFTGHDPSSPILFDAGTLTGDSSSNPICQRLTTTEDNILVLRLGGFDDDDITIGDTGLADHTSISMNESDSGNGTVSGGAGYMIQTTAGDTDLAWFALTASEQFRTVTLAIRPE